MKIVINSMFKNKLLSKKYILITIVTSSMFWKIFISNFVWSLKKKAHIFMNFYRIDDICIIFVFITYFRILRNVCENFFEVENARVYFRNIFKQNKMIFFEYHFIFVIKKKSVNINNDAFIKCFKNDVNFVT